MLPCFRWEHCAASRRKRGASSRTSSRGSGEMRWGGVFLFVGAGFGDKEVREAAVRIEADDAFGISDEIGKGVDVVIEKAVRGVVNYVFDAADFDSGEMHDARDRANDFPRMLVCFNGEAIFHRINGAAGAALEFFACSALANVARAEIVGFSRGANLDGVKIFSAEDFDAGDDAVARRETFLDECGLVHAEAEAIFFDGLLELHGRIEALDACTAAADVRFDDERIADGFGGVHHLGALINDAGFRVVETERIEVRKLNGFGNFVSKSA